MYVITIHQRDRQTEGQTTCDSNATLCVGLRMCFVR